MFWFVLGILFLLSAVAVNYIRKSIDVNVKQPRYLPWAKGVLVAIGVLFIVLSMTATVPTKEEGIKTSFGATTGHLDAGLHWKKPWEKVHMMDAAIQTDTFSDNKSDEICQAVPVRLAAQNTGCVSLSIQWRIVPNSGEELYQDFRSFDHVRDALVTRKTSQAVNEAFANYNPLNVAVSSVSVEETLSEIAVKVKAILDREVKDQITVLSVLIPIVTYDGPTQGRINQLQQQVALTRIAEQKFQTNQKEARANEALAKSVNTSPNVLVARCLETLEEMVKSHDQVPAGFSCWPGQGLAGVIAGPSK